MARETKEQKKLRLESEMTLMEEKKKAFKEKMPAKLMQLQALASKAGVSTNVRLTESGPAVLFSRYNYDSKGNDFEEELTYDTEEWVVDIVEGRINRFIDELNAKASRHKMAQDIFNTLTKEQKEALKENIKFLV